MTSCRIALLLLCCAAAAVQGQFNNRFSSRRTSSSASASSGRSTSGSSSSTFGRSTLGSSSSNSRASNSRASNSRASNPRTGGSRSAFTSGSSQQTSGSSSFNNRQAKPQAKQASSVSFNCPEPDGFFADQNQCDKYFQCTDGVAKEQLCPDGLLFHPERGYPCVFPQETTCARSGLLQDAQPTAECPRQFTTFRSADDSNCATYTRCVNGRAFASACNDGLAFDERSLTCEYADMVESCDVSERAKATADCPRQFGRYALPDTNCQGFKVCVKGEAWEMSCPGDLLWNPDTHMCDYPDVVKDKCSEAYLGFTCPERTFNENQVGEYTKEAHPTECTKFYVCVNKEDGTVAPRLQGCPVASVFDPVSRLCTTEIETVPGCENAIPEEVLASFRQRDSDEKERRANRLAELRSKLQG